MTKRSVQKDLRAPSHSQTDQTSKSWLAAREGVRRIGASAFRALRGQHSLQDEAVWEALLPAQGQCVSIHLRFCCAGLLELGQELGFRRGPHVSELIQDSTTGHTDHDRHSTDILYVNVY